MTAVLAQPRQSALATVTDLAREAGVHEATVSRLARKLGYPGYAAFRSALQTEFLPTEETATRLQRSLQTAAGSGVLATLVAEETAALANLVSHVNEDQLARAAALMIGARRLYIFGRGNAEALALAMMAKRFLPVRMPRASFDRRCPQPGRGRVLAWRPGDALLIYAFRRAPRPYAALAEHAQRGQGCTVIVISDTSGHDAGAPAPDLLLSAPQDPADVDGFQTLDRSDGNLERHCHSRRCFGKKRRHCRHLKRLGALDQALRMRHQTKWRSMNMTKLELDWRRFA